MQLANKLQKTAEKNVFRSKKTTKKVQGYIFKALEVTKTVRLMFWRPEAGIKRKS